MEKLGVFSHDGISVEKLERELTEAEHGIKIAFDNFFVYPRLSLDGNILVI